MSEGRGDGNVSGDCDGIAGGAGAAEDGKNASPRSGGGVDASGVGAVDEAGQAGGGMDASGVGDSHDALPPHERTWDVRPIGVVRSTLVRREDAPRQGFLGSPEAWIELNESARDGLLGVLPGMELVVLTWLHLSDRDRLQVVPSHDPEGRLRGVFSLRAPVRPNPIGLHAVRVLEVDGARLRVADLEALDGTPVLDLKIRLKPPEHFE